MLPVKFNYFKVAKENGCSDENFMIASEQKYQNGERRYLAAHWLAWAYKFYRNNDRDYLVQNLKLFLNEIQRICDK